MKKYTHYRVGLLIGLLTLNTLSACVHTRQELGVGLECFPNRPNCTGHNFGRVARANQKCLGEAAVLFVIGLVAGMYGTYLYFVKTTNVLNTTSNNSNNSVTTIAPLMPTDSTMLNTSTKPLPYNIAPTEAEFIINSTQKNPADLVTNRKPVDGVAVEEPKVLNDEVINRIIDSGFSTEEIQRWLNKGLKIDAKEAETGSTLSMYAIWSRSTPAFKFIISKGADVNAKNKYGETPLMLAVQAGLKDIVDFLIEERKVDVCSTDEHGQTARDLNSTH